MLIYHPAFDAYHCVFRLLLVVDSIAEIEIDKARILDFYLLFPSLLSKVRLPTELSSSVRKQALQFENEYHDPVSPKSSFLDLKPIQDAALRCLAASSLVNRELFQSGLLVRSQVPIPEDLTKLLLEFKKAREPVATSILDQIAKIPLMGVSGLKARTELLEHRYDLV